MGRGGLPDHATASTSGRESAWTCPSNATSGSRGVASRPRPAGVEDESEGYHPHHTVWSWSAGVGKATDGRSVGWNLVSGINDPPELSERGIWVDGEPTEPGPVEFDGLEAIRFDEGSRLDFAGECERQREEKPLRRPLHVPTAVGRFLGDAAGGLELTRGLGVMEHHDAHW